MDKPLSATPQEIQRATRKAAEALNELAELLIDAVPTLGRKVNFRGQFWQTELVFTDGPGDGVPYAMVSLYAQGDLFSETIEYREG